MNIMTERRREMRQRNTTNKNNYRRDKTQIREPNIDYDDFNSILETIKKNPKGSRDMFMKFLNHEADKINTFTL